MPHIERDGVEVFYESFGDGPEIVLLHPITGNRYVWAHQIFAFARDHRVIAVDLRGHGRSGKPARGYAISEMAADVRQILDAERVAAAVLVGNSMGGMVALQTALDVPARVRGCVVISSGTALAVGAPAGTGEAIAANYLGALDAMFGGATSATTRRERPEVVDTIAALYRVPGNIPREVFLACGSDPGGVFHWDIRDRLAHISCPTLVLAGAEDLTLPAARSQSLAAGIPGARCELVPDVGHFYPMEQPARFNARLRMFLGELTAST